MTTKERFYKAFNFINPGDRLPVFEHSWWGLTVDRWQAEGLDIPWEEFNGYFGHDIVKYTGLWPISEEAWHNKERTRQGKSKDWYIDSESDYDGILSTLYTDGRERRMLEELNGLKDGYERGEYTVVIAIHGFFWHSRELLGIEPHFYTFYDNPGLIHRIHRNYCDFAKRVLAQALEILTPLYVILSEDMCYKTGPMLSKAMYDEFIKPYYLELAPIIRQAGTKFMIDSDGNIHEMIPWMLECGVEGSAPLERNAGNDLCRIREQYPDFLMTGGYDKLVMNQGEAAIRAEFERIFPVMRSGGYLPGVDHQTPPSVSLSDYRLWMSVYREYAARAAKEWTGNATTKNQY